MSEGERGWGVADWDVLRWPFLEDTVLNELLTWASIPEMAAGR